MVSYIIDVFEVKLDGRQYFRRAAATTYYWCRYIYIYRGMRVRVSPDVLALALAVSGLFCDFDLQIAELHWKKRICCGCCWTVGRCQYTNSSAKQWHMWENSKVNIYTMSTDSESDCEPPDTSDTHNTTNQDPLTRCLKDILNIFTHDMYKHANCMLVFVCSRVWEIEKGK